MAQDPKLQALANHINARLAQPSLLPLPSSQGQLGVQASHQSSPSITHGLTGPAPTIGNTALAAANQPWAPRTPLAPTLPTTPSGVNQINQANGMEGYFQNESQAILKQQRGDGMVSSSFNGQENEQPSKKKILLMGVYVGGAVFLISFIILVAVRPRFVMKKVKKENGTEELKCNFLGIFLISLTLLIIVLATAGISAAKAGKA